MVLNIVLSMVVWKKTKTQNSKCKAHTIDFNKAKKVLCEATKPLINLISLEFSSLRQKLEQMQKGGNICFPP